MTEYRRIRKFERGGQGDVWLGLSENDEPVAMKFLRAVTNPRDQAENLKRFEHEVKCHTTLEHPGVMPILFADLDVDEPYFVMPLASGRMPTRGASGEPLPRDQALHTFLLVVDAVAYAHNEGVIHRDLKPGNILVLNGRPVVTDFGLGRSLYSTTDRLTKTRARMGTLGYSAPEQFGDARNADASADVYALGVILAEMLSGSFQQGSHVDFDELPSRFRYIVMKCLQPQRKYRYPSAVELRSDFARLDVDPALRPAPALEAERLASSLADGDEQAAEDFLRLFIENESDVQLYLRSLPTIQTVLLEMLGTSFPSLFNRVIQALCHHTAGQFTSSFVDRVAYFLKAAFRATEDEATHRAILERLTLLAFENENDYPVRRFGEICEEVLGVPRYPEMIAELLVRRPKVLPIVAERLREITDLPDIVEQVLRSRGV